MCNKFKKFCTEPTHGVIFLGDVFDSTEKVKSGSCIGKHLGVMSQKKMHTSDGSRRSQ